MAELTDPAHLPRRSGNDVAAAAPAQQQPPLPRACCRRVAAWREREAQRVNIPRQRLLKDEVLLEIAATAPDTPSRPWPAPAACSAASPKGRIGESLLAAIAAAEALPDAALAGGAARNATAPRPSPALVSLLKVLLAAKCEHHHVAARLVASSDDIDRLAVEDDAGHPGAARLAPRGVRRGRAGVAAGTHRAWCRGPADQADPSIARPTVHLSRERERSRREAARVRVARRGLHPALRGSTPQADEVCGVAHDPLAASTPKTALPGHVCGQNARPPPPAACATPPRRNC